MDIAIPHLVGGFNPSEKYEFVSWYDYTQYMESHKSHVPNHQPVIMLRFWDYLIIMYNVYIYIHIIIK